MTRLIANTADWCCNNLELIKILFWELYQITDTMIDLGKSRIFNLFYWRCVVAFVNIMLFFIPNICFYVWKRRKGGGSRFMAKMCFGVFIFIYMCMSLFQKSLCSRNPFVFVKTLCWELQCRLQSSIAKQFWLRIIVQKRTRGIWTALRVPECYVSYLGHGLAVYVLI